MPITVPGGTVYSMADPPALNAATITPLGAQTLEGADGVPMVAGLIVQLLIESLMNLTEPSQKAKLAPPGWKLLGAEMNSSVPLRVTQTAPRLTLKGAFWNVFIPKNVVNIVSP